MDSNHSFEWVNNEREFMKTREAKDLKIVKKKGHMINLSSRIDKRE